MTPMTQIRNTQSRRPAGGFTLVELLIVLALIFLTVGVSSDVVLNLVRANSKTQITNEIEQEGNFSVGKIEKELMMATSVSGGALQVETKTLIITQSEVGAQRQITYTIETSGNLRRTEALDGVLQSDILLVDSSVPGGVQVVYANSFFVIIKTNPFVVRIHFKLQQVASGAPAAFRGSVVLDQAVVVRGSY